MVKSMSVDLVLSYILFVHQSSLSISVNEIFDSCTNIKRKLRLFVNELGFSFSSIETSLVVLNCVGSAFDLLVCLISVKLTVHVALVALAHCTSASHLLLASARLSIADSYNIRRVCCGNNFVPLRITFPYNAIDLHHYHHRRRRRRHHHRKPHTHSYTSSVPDID